MNTILQLSLAGLLTFSSGLAVPNQAPEPVRLLTLPQMIAERAIDNQVDADLAVKIAFCESTLRQFTDSGKPLRGIHNPDDIGVFQINEHYHLDQSKKLGLDIATTNGNIDYAMYLLKKDGAQRHWSASQACWSKDIAQLAKA
jgi:hypothetical protein